jgi:hypothetical protein
VLGDARRYREPNPTKMQNPPRRTNATNLSDDELLLFDFLFDKNLSFHHLRIEHYSFHMNCLYSHSLNDADLELTLASLVARGLLNCKVGKIWRIETREYVDGKIYALTESGGHLWELERLPDWDRYLTTSQWMLGTNNRGMIRIVCPNEEIGRLCMGAMFAAGLIAPIGRIRVRNIWDAMLLPWKTFGKVKSIRCKTSDNANDAMFPSLWNVYNARRCWWRDIAELDTLANREL